jgi:hypothetical protein
MPTAWVAWAAAPLNWDGVAVATVPLLEAVAVTREAVPAAEDAALELAAADETGAAEE